MIGAKAVPQLNGSAGGGVGTGTDETKGRAAQALRDGDNNTGLKKVAAIDGLDSEWEIDFFGKVASRVESQAYTAEALREARDWVYVAIAADVSRLYFGLRARQQRLKILYRGIDGARKVGDLTQTRLDRGLTNELDVLLAKRELASAEIAHADTPSPSHTPYVCKFRCGAFDKEAADSGRRSEWPATMNGGSGIFAPPTT